MFTGIKLQASMAPIQKTSVFEIVATSRVFNDGVQNTKN